MREAAYLEFKVGREEFDCFFGRKILIQEREDATIREEAEVSVVCYEVIHLGRR